MEFICHRVARTGTCKCGAAFTGPPNRKMCDACRDATKGKRHRAANKRLYRRKKKAAK